MPLDAMGSRSSSTKRSGSTTPEHAVELTRLLPHARLVVLPGGHGDYLGEIMSPKSDAAEMTSRLIEQFLDAADAS